ncbi:MAG: hypothetical protein ABSH20_07575 [Tepidisphaeraceae bacterium]|jgi:hypothetical protein
MKASLLPIVLFAVSTLAAEPGWTVDHRYSIPWWQTASCAPDDPDKPLVGREGQFFFDYGNGGPRRFAISIAASADPEPVWQKQQTFSPRVPIVQTFKQAGPIEILEEAFLVPPTNDARPAPLFRVAPGSVEPAIQRNWAKPKAPADPAFPHIAVGSNARSIEYVLKAPASGKATIVIGLCEGWHPKAGQRPLILSVEGAPPRTVDPVADFGADVPGVYLFDAADTDGDGLIRIAVKPVADAPDTNTILNALWAFDGKAPLAVDIVAGKASSAAYAYLSFAQSQLPPRLDLITLQLTNKSDKPAEYKPIVAIDSIYTPAADGPAVFAIGPSTHIAVSHPVDSSTIAKPKSTLLLKPVALAPGQSQTVVLAIYRNYGRPIDPITPGRAAQLRQSTEKFWTDADLPYAAVSLPDPAIQGMFDSSIRNIYQAREIKNGLPAFHVGPTCYRGLWVVDGSFILEAVTMLGRPADTRAGIDYLMSFQKPDGRFEIIHQFWKENGIVPWAVTRHAMLTQDKQWLGKHWPNVKRTIAFMQTLRHQTMGDPNRPDFGLLPPGDVDGGISNAGASARPEFSNTEWCLGGLKSAIAAARWLGDEDSAAAWQKEYDEFYAAFLKAAHRDIRKDAHDNSYLPTMMLNAGDHSPQKGQWGFLHAVYPGQVFSKDSPLVAGQLAMLRATKTQGLVFDTGWMKDGIWTYAASFYGHALLWQGEGQEAAQVLYDYANHASPTRVWREEQKPVGQKYQEVGDMPHNWASAEFIRLTLHLLELDRGDELHLLEGLPRPWATAGKTTRLNGVLTPFGPLTMTLAVAADGKTAALTVRPLTRKPAKIVVHLDGLTGKAGTLEIEQKAEGTTTMIPLQ